MAKPHATKSRKSRRPERKDPYLDAIGEVWPHIVFAYNDFKDEKPVLEYELPRKIIYAYEASEYIDSLTARTREQTHRIQRRAAAAGKFLLFVRDTKKKVLRSYVFPVEDKL